MLVSIKNTNKIGKKGRLRNAKHSPSSFQTQRSEHLAHFARKLLCVFDVGLCHFLPHGLPQFFLRFLQRLGLQLPQLVFIPSPPLIVHQIAVTIHQVALNVQPCPLASHQLLLPSTASRSSFRSIPDIVVYSLFASA